MATEPVTETPINLPIIDISNPDDPAVGKAMIDAAATHGFLYVDSRGTDFTAEDVDEAFELSKKFFASPLDEKSKYPISPDNCGWSGMHTETLDPEHQRTGDFKEAMNFGEFKNGKAQQPLPPSLLPHESRISHFSHLCNKTCERILKLLALGLEIDPTFFTTRHNLTQSNPNTNTHKPTGSTLRYLYYPSVSSPATKTYKHDTDVRAGAHSDYGSVTLLFQRPGQPGLEILADDGDGSWCSVPVYPNYTTNNEENYPFPPILINIGDLLSYWTDGLLKSTIHRVVFPLSEQQQQQQQQEQEQGCPSPSSSPSPSPTPSPNPHDRYSIVFFCHPVNDTELVPVPSRVVAGYREECEKGGPDEQKRRMERVGFGGGAGSLVPGQRALTAEEHLGGRLSATYGF